MEVDEARIVADGNAALEELNPQELRNLAVRLAKMETEEELRMALSGVLSGRMMQFFFKHLHDAQAKAAEQQRKNRADMFYLALLQAQLDQLNEQIAWYTGEIERLEQEVSEIDQLIDDIQAGTLDPNDPTDAALMRKYGIDPDDLDNGGAAALDKLRSAKDRRNDQIKQYRVDRNALINDRDSLAELKAKEERLRDIQHDKAAMKETVADMTNAEKTALAAEVVQDRDLVDAVRIADGQVEHDVQELSSFDLNGQSNTDNGVGISLIAFDTGLSSAPSIQLMTSAASQIDPIPMMKDKPEIALNHTFGSAVGKEYSSTDDGLHSAAIAHVKLDTTPSGIG